MGGLLLVNPANIPAPDQAASSISFSEVTDQSMTVTFEPGNGQKRVVLIAEDTPQILPVTIQDGTELTGKTDFSLATEYQTGWKVVYVGDQSSVNISGLFSDTGYIVTVIEYNGSFTETRYLNTGAPVAFQRTLPGVLPPTIQASNILFSDVTNQSFVINFQAGNGGKRVVLMAEDSPTLSPVIIGDGTELTGNPDFALATEYQAGWKVVYVGDQSSVNITGLLSSTRYLVTIIEYNGETFAGTRYLNENAPVANQQTLSGILAPTIPASDINFIFVSTNFMNITFTPGNGAQRLVVMKMDSEPDFIPVDNTSYSGDLSNGNVIVYNGSGEYFPLFNLTADALYYFKIYEYNTDESGKEISYLKDVAPLASQRTLPEIFTPTIPASNITFTNITPTSMTVAFTSGNGGQRLAVLKAEYFVDFWPYDDTQYFGQQNYGNEVVYDGSGNTFDLNNLQPNTMYYFKIYEYNTNGLHFRYLTSETLMASQSTMAIPNVHVITPAEGSINQNVNNLIVSASKIDKAKTYTIELSTLSDFSSSVITKSGSRTQTFSGMMYNTTYYARVKTNLSPYYGKVTSFSTAPANYFAYVISPSDNATGVGTTVTVSSNSINQATNYAIELNTASDFSGTSIVQSSPLPSMLFSGLSIKTTYYTRVLTDLSMGQWGKTTSFTTGSKKTSASRTNGDESITEEDNVEFKVTIVENPFKQRLTFMIHAPIEEDAAVKLSDLSGKSIVQLIEKTNKTIEIEKPLVPGMYLLQVYTRFGSRIVRVVKVEN
jgi:hypothetical protein